MCRLFGLLTDERSSAEPWLLQSDRSLLLQSNHSLEEAQNDGWGIAWYPDPTGIPRLEKGVRGAHDPAEHDHFLAAARAAQGPVILGHLRYASNPLHLPPTQLLALANSQPFVHENYLFGHNGMIPLPIETRSLLGDFDRRIQGVNDSEVLFWLLVRRCEELGDPLRAYSTVVQDLTAVWETHGRPGQFPFSGLNVLFSRAPDELWAFCAYRGEHGNSFFQTDRPYYEMSYRSTGRGILVGSEPLDGSNQEWKTLANGEYLFGQRTDGHLSLKTGTVPAPTAVPGA
jgi:predicted glutamine amidotransferase